MLQFTVLIAIFLLASLSSLGLIYASKAFQIYQQLIPILLLIDIVIASRIRTKSSALNLPKLMIIFISAFLVQIIVISSGGLYSPLLILIHIFTLGAIFLIGNSAPISFLIFSLGVLFFQVSFDKNLYQFFQNDPWTVIIYALSIVIVIPLALYLSHSNNVRNKFTNFLRDYIEMSERRQKSILTALSNLVIVTDKNLSIVSVNTALERLLRLSANQVMNKPLFEVITLKDSSGQIITADGLPIKEAIADKATHFTEGYGLETKIQALPKSVSIQIKPVSNIQGEIIQLIFVFTDPTTKIGFNTHPSIEQAVKRHHDLLNLITDSKQNLSPLSIQLLILFIAHIEEDILTVQEMEDHPLQEVIGFEDLVIFINRVTESKKHFYSLLGIIPQLIYEDDDRSEETYLNMNKSELSQNTSPLSKYSAPIDSYLFKIVLERLVDLAVFVSSSLPQKKVDISLRLTDEGQTILLDINFSCGNMKPTELPNLFKNNYPNLKFSNLNNSSGLEGYIVNKITKTIQTEVLASLNPYNKLITLSMSLPKQAKITQ